MTIDERLQFLLQSTESLHASVQEQSAQIAQHTEQLKIDAENIAQHTAQLKIDAENIRRLATIAAAHEDRISGLENGNG